MSRLFPGPLELVRMAVRAAVPEGSTVVDATAGNGHDTMFLANCVGPGGKVYAFDIQEQALANASARLQEAALRERVVLIGDGHEKLIEYVRFPVAAVMFNLGYLPGGDHQIITGSENTIAALGQGVEVLQPGGVISIVIYRGHPGGREEAGAVERFVEGLDQRFWDVARVDFPNRRNFPPYPVLIQKRGG